MLCKRWRNTNDELVPGSFIFVPGFRDKKVPVENETWSNAEMDWDNEQICHWLTAVGVGEYVQVFICHTCTCITAIKQYYRFDQSVSNLISIF